MISIEDFWVSRALRKIQLPENASTITTYIISSRFAKEEDFAQGHGGHREERRKPWRYMEGQGGVKSEEDLFAPLRRYYVVAANYVGVANFVGDDICCCTISSII